MYLVFTRMPGESYRRRETRVFVVVAVLRIDSYLLNFLFIFVLCLLLLLLFLLLLVDNVAASRTLYDVIDNDVICSHLLRTSWDSLFEVQYVVCPRLEQIA